MVLLYIPRAVLFFWAFLWSLLMFLGMLYMEIGIPNPGEMKGSKPTPRTGVGILFLCLCPVVCMHLRTGCGDQRQSTSCNFGPRERNTQSLHVLYVPYNWGSSGRQGGNGAISEGNTESISKSAYQLVVLVHLGESREISTYFWMWWLVSLPVISSMSKCVSPCWRDNDQYIPYFPLLVDATS